MSPKTLKKQGQPRRGRIGGAGDRALASIRKLIQDGALPAGARLPAEQDLANDLGVSRGTVRGALDKLEEEGLVRGTKNKGRSVVPNVAIRTSIMSQTVALLTCLPGDDPRYRKSGRMEAVDAAAAEAAAGAGLHALTLQPNGFDTEGVGRMIADPPRGVLIAHAVGENAWGRPVLKRLHEAGVPLVVNGDAPELAGYDRVVPDHEKGAFDLTKWLIARGRKRIVRVCTVNREDYWIKARDAGYERAMKSARLKPLEPLIVEGYEMPRDATRENFDAQVRLFVGYLVERLKETDALMAVTDSEVYAIAAACRLLGKKPNEDIDLVGYDNIADLSTESQFEQTGAVATVDKRNDAAGEAMVKLLLDRIEGRLPRGPQRVVVEPELRVL